MEKLEQHVQSRSLFKISRHIKDSGRNFYASSGVFVIGLFKFYDLFSTQGKTLESGHGAFLISLLEILGYAEGAVHDVSLEE